MEMKLELTPEDIMVLLTLIRNKVDALEKTAVECKNTDMLPIISAQARQLYELNEKILDQYVGRGRVKE